MSEKELESWYQKLTFTADDFYFEDELKPRIKAILTEIFKAGAAFGRDDC